jgi:hypothetical protein
VRGTSCKNFSISIFGFLMCSQINVELWLKFCSSYMVYSHIWVNLAWDYCHLFYILPLWLKTKILKKNIDAHGYKIKWIFFKFSAALTSLPHVLWLERKRLILTGWIKAHFPLNICTLRLPLVHKALYFWLLHTIESLKIFQRNKTRKNVPTFKLWVISLHGIKFSLPILRGPF